MKGKISTIAAAIAALLLFPHPASASWSPLGFGLFVTGKDEYGRVAAAALPQPEDSVYGFNFSAINGKLKEMHGLCVAGFGMDTGATAGLGVASICNATDNADKGVLQISGICNFIADSGEGSQIAGFINVAEDFAGLQVAAINWIGGTFSGVQIGAINIGDGDVNGAQIGAFNTAQSLMGVQIGAVNIVDRNFCGVQIGAINIVKSSNIAMLPVLRAAF